VHPCDDAYRQRFDWEHVFRFGKHHLVWDPYPTPEGEHEENGWELACLAATPLGLAASRAAAVPRPWERSLPMLSNRPIPGPTQVQRDFGRMIRPFGTPAQSPEPRGKSPGRPKGGSPGVRPRQPGGVQEPVAASKSGIRRFLTGTFRTKRGAGLSKVQ
jgi:hypothetical protein